MLGIWLWFNSTKKGHIERPNSNDQDTFEYKVTQKNGSVHESVEVTTAAWVVEELKGFARFSKKAGVTKTVTIHFSISECSIAICKCQRTVELGAFQ